VNNSQIYQNVGFNPKPPQNTNTVESKVIDSPKFLEFVNSNSGRQSLEKNKSTNKLQNFRQSLFNKDNHVGKKKTLNSVNNKNMFKFEKDQRVSPNMYFDFLELNQQKETQLDHSESNASTERGAHPSIANRDVVD